MRSATRPAFRYKAKVLRIVDGDTVICEVDLGFTVSAKVILRLARIDAPDKQPEKDRATHYLSSLIEGKSVLIQSFKTEKYGRWLAEIWAEETGNNINDIMVSSGQAKVYG